MLNVLLQNRLAFDIFGILKYLKNCYFYIQNILNKKPDEN